MPKIIYNVEYTPIVHCGKLKSACHGPLSLCSLSWSVEITLFGSSHISLSIHTHIHTFTVNRGYIAAWWIFWFSKHTFSAAQLDGVWIGTMAQRRDWLGDSVCTQNLSGRVFVNMDAAPFSWFEFPSSCFLFWVTKEKGSLHLPLLRLSIPCCCAAMGCLCMWRCLWQSAVPIKEHYQCCLQCSLRQNVCHL